ncbi:esterase-like activity of phytase family protein [Ideonella paludis]|uniref:Esterase-like activity of phytase family protein n=1 Tax=Ideonella paludis TaxID=1233411 RepID=A0ABS5E2T8_9BURK|nr:esterase-like activity of phytase family protein [Ideonella paludis]MBQ0937713.1 esterase-like activity of phytase family protein [Ideonella paludis]
MKKLFLKSVVLAMGCAALAAHAAPTLIATGQLPGDATDLSGQSALLENGVRGNLLGGLGSGLAWAGGTTFVALPDRGPNATEWNAAVDNTSSWIPRLQTLTITLSPNPSGPLPYTLNAQLTGTTLLWSKEALVYGPAVPAANKRHKHHFSGRSDNFSSAANSLSSSNARLDPEGIRVSRNGRKVFISDEYGPYVYEFSRETGRRLRVFELPASTFAATSLSAMGSVEISGNSSGRVANKGMEGLAISPDGKTLFGFMQSPLIQDGGDGGRANRIVKIDLATGAISQYAYDNFIPAMNKAYNSSEILALNSHEFLVLERDGKGLGDGSAAVVKQIWKVDLSAAQDVSNLSGATALLAAAPAKTLFLDVRAALNAAGFADTQIPAKLEAMTFGPDIMVDGQVKHTLYLANDNDFLATTAAGLNNPNQFFVFAFDSQDLGGSVFENQRFGKTLPR